MNILYLGKLLRGSAVKDASYHHCETYRRAPIFYAALLLATGAAHTVVSVLHYTNLVGDIDMNIAANCGWDHKGFTKSARPALSARRCDILVLPKIGLFHIKEAALR